MPRTWFYVDFADDDFYHLASLNQHCLRRIGMSLTEVLEHRIDDYRVVDLLIIANILQRGPI